MVYQSFAKSPISVHTEKKDLVFHKASEFLIKCLKLYRNITHKTLVLLSGGSAVNLYGKLAEFVKNSSLNFSFLAVGQVDERYLQYQRSKIKDQKSKLDDINSIAIEKSGLWEACRKKSIPYYLVSQEGELEEATEEYNRIIERLFKEYVYKIAVLGIGEDGHTAGLMPGYEEIWNTDKYIVGYQIPQNRQNNAMALSCQGKRNFQRNFPCRISLTPKALKLLDQAIIVAAGKKKREAIKKAIDGKNSDMINEIPGVIVQQIPKVDLFTPVPVRQKLNI